MFFALRKAVHQHRSEIADGQFTEADVAAINAMLDKTEPEVTESIAQLRRLADLIGGDRHVASITTRKHPG